MCTVRNAGLRTAARNDCTHHGNDLALLPSGPDAVRRPEIAQVPSRGRPATGLPEDCWHSPTRPVRERLIRNVTPHAGVGRALPARHGRFGSPHPPSILFNNSRVPALPSRTPAAWSPGVRRARPPASSSSIADVLLVGVRHVNGARAEQQRRAPGRQERDVGGVGEHRRFEAVHASRSLHRRHLQHFVDLRTRPPTVARQHRAHGRRERPRFGTSSRPRRAPGSRWAPRRRRSVRRCSACGPAARPRATARRASPPARRCSFSMADSPSSG